MLANMAKKSQGRIKQNRINYREALVNKVPLKKEIETYMSNFENIKDIKKYDKFYFDGDKLIVHKNAYLQGFSRWFYSLNRYELIDKLDRMLNEYKKVTNMLEHEISSTLPYNARVNAIELIAIVNKFNLETIHGINNLIITYKDDKEINKKLTNLLCYLTNIDVF